MKREKRLGWVSSQTEVIARTAELARVWGTTDQVGIAEEIDLGEVGLLALLVEKDFACVERRDEDNGDTFDNPHASANCRPVVRPGES